jgi:hypothetical protein
VATAQAALEVGPDGVSHVSPSAAVVTLPQTSPAPRSARFQAKAYPADSRKRGEGLTKEEKAGQSASGGRNHRRNLHCFDPRYGLGCDTPVKRCQNCTTNIVVQKQLPPSFYVGRYQLAATYVLLAGSRQDRADTRPWAANISF